MEMRYSNASGKGGKLVGQKDDDEDRTNFTVDTAPEFLKGADLSSRAEVRRPRCQIYREEVDAIEFMQIDVEYYIDKPPGKLTHNSEFK